MNAMHRWIVLASFAMGLMSCAGLEIEGKKTETGGMIIIKWGSDGTFEAEAPPNTCLQFQDTHGKPVGDPIPLGPEGHGGGVIPDGAKGWTAGVCEEEEPDSGGNETSRLVAGGSGGSAGGQVASGGVLGSGLLPRTEWFEIAGGFGLLGGSHQALYRFRVQAFDAEQAREVAATYAAMLSDGPFAAPAPPSNLEILFFSATELAPEAPIPAGNALVYGLSEEAATAWSVEADGVSYPEHPEVQLPSGLWMTSTPVPLAGVDLSPGAFHDVRTSFSHPGCPAGKEIVDEYQIAALPD